MLWGDPKRGGTPKEWETLKGWGAPWGDPKRGWDLKGVGNPKG